jgi:hypothetical protein
MSIAHLPILALRMRSSKAGVFSTVSSLPVSSATQIFKAASSQAVDSSTANFQEPHFRAAIFDIPASLAATLFSMRWSIISLWSQIYASILRITWLARLLRLEIRVLLASIGCAKLTHESRTTGLPLWANPNGTESTTMDSHGAMLHCASLVAAQSHSIRLR